MIEILEGFDYYPEIKAVLAVEPSSQLFEEKDMQPVEIGKHKIAPWGQDNNLPADIRNKIEASEVMGTNVRFNRDVCYGLGPKLVRVIRDKNKKVVDYVEVESGKEYDFFERNDIPMFLLEHLTDLVTFHNAFVELIPDSASQDIYSMRNKEAMFSRWATMKNGNIDFHYYSAKWADSPGINDIAVSKVLNEFDALKDLTAKVALKKVRMIFPVYMPSPGRPYYSRPDWYSLFESGWYDHSVSIPTLKKAIMKNNLGVKSIIYISQKYFDDIMDKEKIDRNDYKAVKARIEKEKTGFNEFLSGSENANKAIMALKDYVMSGNSSVENKWIEIVPIKNELNGGEYLTDVETVANLMCYAMGVHPSLIGATPGKSSGSLGGTDKRELFMMKQALMKPLLDRAMRPLRLIKSYNKWDPEVTVVVPEYLFTTLDKNKSGKEESVPQKA